jgi:tetratricopeptide (TPR) repeat protein
MNFRLLLSIAFITVLTACGGAEERKAVYMEKAKSSIEAGDLDKARIELKNVLQIDPKDGEAYFQLGKVFEQQQDFRKAYGNYLKAEELSPELLENHARLGRFYLLLMKDSDKAQEKVDLILSKEPENADGLMLKAALILQDKDKAGAIAIAKDVVARDPGYVEGATFLATLYVSDKNNQEAITLLDGALKNNPDNESLNKLLAAILVQDKKYERAEVIYKGFLERNPDITASYNNLAAFYNQTDSKDKAEEILRASIENEPADVERQLTLIKYIRETKGNDEAIAETKKLIESHSGQGKLRTALAELYLLAEDKTAATDVLINAIKDFPEEITGVEARASLAGIYISNEDYEKAREVVDEAINISPNDPKVNMLRARLALNEKDMETATISLRIVAKETPENIDAYLLLANIYQLEKNDEQLNSTLNSAFENNKRNADGLLKLVQVLLNRDIVLAEKAIDQYNKLKENDYKGLSVKALILNQKKEFSDAYAISTKLMELFPDQPNGYLQTIYYYNESNDVARAISTLEKGYINTKNNRKILTMLTNLQLSEKQFDIVEKRINAELKAAPDDEELKLLLTKAYLANNNIDAAERTLKDVVDNNSVSDEPYLTLMQIQVSKDEKAKAVATLEKGYTNVENNRKILGALTQLQVQEKEFDAVESRIKAELSVTPEDEELQLLLSKVYLANKKVDEAEAILKEVVSKETASEEAYLLLSQIYQSKKDTDSLEAFLVKGKSNVPSSLKIPLALATVYESNSKYSAAIDVYRELHESQPDNLVITNNLASLLSDHGDGKGDLELAKNLSDKLLESKQPVFLDTIGWVNYKLGDYQKAVSYLTQVVEKSPDVNVFNYHLGMSYKMLGNKEKAKIYLEKSLADDKPFKEKDLAQAALKEL